MNIKQKIRAVVSCLITVSLFMLLLMYSTEVLERKDADNKYAPFFQQQNYDVLFMGTSHVMYGVSPMDLWHDYGITSYNFGNQGQPLPSTYWVMENVLDYTTPKLMVIDCYYLTSVEKINLGVHKTLDAFPISRTKIDAVLDLVDQGNTDLTYLEFFWDFSRYHYRWNDLHDYDFERIDTKAKGGEYHLGIVTGKEMVKIPRENKMTEDTIAIEYLEKMIIECQNRGIDVLLTYLPFPASEEDQKEANRVYDIAKEYGVGYLNFLDLDIINFETDYFDNGHLNVSGIRKTTNYLGQYIMEHYTIEDRRRNELYREWHIDYEEFKEDMQSKLKSFESLEYYMLLLLDDNYMTLIEVNNPEIWDNEYYLHLFENLGVDKNDITKKTDFCLIQNAGEQVDCFEDFYKSDKRIETVLGELGFRLSETGAYKVSLDGEEIYEIIPEQNQNVDIRIVVLDKDTAEIVDQSTFSKKNEAIRMYGKN